MTSGFQRIGLQSSGRALAWRVAPDRMANRARRYERDYRARQGITTAAERLASEQGAIVSAGPFVGLRYPADRLADVDTPVGKLTGVYEEEIHQPFEAAIARGVTTFLDVGCADGYYAVGMPYRSPGLITHAFDLSADARELCRRVARINDLEDRVNVGKRFSARSLDNLNTDGALMLCDIEGGEVRLFDRELVRRLTNTTVVIEVHEDFRPGAGSDLTSRFAGSHSVRMVAQRETIKRPVLAEYRPPLLHWLVAEPLIT
jgi:hypothetical protein